MTSRFKFDFPNLIFPILRLSIFDAFSEMAGAAKFGIERDCVGYCKVSGGLLGYSLFRRVLDASPAETCKRS